MPACGLMPAPRTSRRRITRSPSRRVHVEPDDIDQFLLETRVVGQFDRLHPMRFEPPRVPHQLHRRLRHPRRGSHRPTAPMGFTLRAVVLRQIEDLVDLGLRDRRFTATTLADLTQLRQTLLAEPVTPAPHHAGDTDNDAAIAVLATPSAAISSALALITSRCAPDCDRATTQGPHVVLPTSPTQARVVSCRNHNDPIANLLQDTPLLHARRPV